MSTNQQGEQRRPGIPCPQCGFFIEMSIQNILYQAEFKCPSCLLELKMDRSGSQSALEMLQQIHVAQENVQNSRKFDL
jgi:hypothetical protein